MSLNQALSACLAGIITLFGISIAPAADLPGTYCNPLDLDYRFQLDDPVRREAADPAVVRYKDEYWLFASKSGGYWHSKDFCHWTFVEGGQLPIEDYAPAPAVINGQLYYTAFNTRAIYCAEDPYSGKWIKVGDLNSYPDPDLFQDDDSRVYIYYGCSANGGINVVELDPAHQFKEIGQPLVCLNCDPPHRGWEVPGNENDGAGDSWIEGAWMTKHGGKYYLQYAAPGTQFHSYADGIFVGTTPKGPFTYAPYSPFSQKPTGFVTGAGHSGTFQDAQSNWWRVVTMVISVRHMFERRIGLFPVGFTDDGQMYCNTGLGDYPQFLPGAKNSGPNENATGWMLLSYDKKAEASSELAGFSATNAFDENIQTWWSAKTGNAGEWLKVDLGKICDVDAIQINFADQGAQAHGKLRDDAYQYYVEASSDGVKWNKILDRSDNHRDAPNDYEPLDHPVRARYLRLVNVHCPAQAFFSVSGFRIFGNGLGHAPAPVQTFTVQRKPGDGRKAIVAWSPSTGADFYIVRYGIAPDRLYNNYQIYHATEANINSLNTGVVYYFTVDACNDSGVTHTVTTSRLAP
ncbi:MAG TPA: family 43 glycosylhydrolase [Pseudomonadales bacterium]|nr:family 43 glycosylhydrolase [Pseudomonadales bacterium]